MEHKDTMPELHAGAEKGDQLDANCSSTVPTAVSSSGAELDFEHYIKLCLHNIEQREDLEREPLKKEMHSLWVKDGWNQQRLVRCVEILEQSLAIYRLQAKLLRRRVKELDKAVKNMNLEIERVEAGYIPLLQIADFPASEPSVETKAEKKQTTG